MNRPRKFISAGELRTMSAFESAVAAGDEWFLYRASLAKEQWKPLHRTFVMNMPYRVVRGSVLYRRLRRAVVNPEYRLWALQEAGSGHLLASGSEATQESLALAGGSP